jgi:hypothetical protein
VQLSLQLFAFKNYVKSKEYAMRLFAKEKPVELPRHHEVVDAKVVPVVGKHHGNKGRVFGFAVVLINAEDRLSPAFILGDKPKTVEEAVLWTLGAYGPQERGHTGPQLYEGSHAAELLSNLSQIKSIEEELKAPVSHVGVRQSETFTPINNIKPPQTYEPLGPYDID